MCIRDSFHSIEAKFKAVGQPFIRLIVKTYLMSHMDKMLSEGFEFGFDGMEVYVGNR